MELNRRDAFRAIAVAALAGERGAAIAQQPVAAGDELKQSAVIAPPKTWEELKAEVQLRTDRQVYPMTGMRSEDVRVILNRIGSLDRGRVGTLLVGHGARVDRERRCRRWQQSQGGGGGLHHGLALLGFWRLAHRHLP